MNPSSKGEKWICCNLGVRKVFLGILQIFETMWEMIANFNYRNIKNRLYAKETSKQMKAPNLSKIELIQFCGFQSHLMTFFFLFAAVAAAFGRSQTKGQFRAAAVTYTADCSKIRSLTRWARPGIVPTSSQRQHRILNPLMHNRNSVFDDFWRMLLGKCFHTIVGQVASFQKICSVLSPGTCACDHLWKEGPLRCSQLRHRLDEMGPSSTTGILIRRGKFRPRHTQKEESHVRTEVETGVMNLQVTQHLGLSRSHQKPGERRKTGFSPVALLTPWLWTSGIQDCERGKFLLFDPPWLIICYYSSRKWIDTLMSNTRVSWTSLC